MPASARLLSIEPEPPPEPHHASVAVAVQGISKAFGTTPALHGVTLTIEAGELMALLGPSGSGKTTLLRVLAGLEPPSAGRVLFGNTDAAALTVQERQVGFVFQNYALFRHMTVFDNIAFGLRVRPRRLRPSADQIRRRVLELLDLVQLSRLEQRFPAQLSGGQNQRVALARALAIEPRVLLLDEPFGALDAQVRKDLRRWLRELHRKTGHTTVFVTHDQDEALELADRVAILRGGRIEQVGTPSEVAEGAASLFVYAFVGDANSLPVAVTGSQVYFHGEPLGITRFGAAHGAATLAFRPGDVELVSESDTGIGGVVTGRRRHGGSWRVEIEVAGGGRIEIALPATTDLPDGIRVRLRPTQWRLYTP
ncbi:MAG TPA: sulfate/molybdate ABC transporter ATP-binding protein [Hyphomicrobiales bacterium]|nr:sulfate/molybdate ABC transporter ATP-binding protein [Hyphomicrobiales bacterium]